MCAAHGVGHHMINRDIAIDVLLNRYPKAAVFLLRRGLVCVGCPIATFHTIADAANLHQQSPDDLLAALDREIDRLYPSADLDPDHTAQD